jgi:serine/threonine protein kinase
MDFADEEWKKTAAFLVEIQFLNQAHVDSLWEEWQQYRIANPGCHPFTFFMVKGISVELLRHLDLSANSDTTIIEFAEDASVSSCKTESIESGKTEIIESSPEEELIASNFQVAEEIRREGLIAADTLERVVERCNQTKERLGHILIQENMLKRSECLRIIKQVMAKVLSQAAAPPMVHLLKGTRFGEYEILNEIARGGMGIVYRARHVNTQEIVALKVLLTATPRQIQRFFREIKTTSALNHPNIVPFYSMGKEHGYPYFTMKYIEGTTFQAVIEHPDTPLEKKISILTQVCHTLHYAHTHKVVHRDVKPSNILVAKDGEPFLADFGLAKFIGASTSLTGSGRALGTPFYMSPEQVKGEKHLLSYTSDIYSLGVILYQILTGKTPFEADTLPALYHKILHEEPPSPRRHNPAIPLPLVAVCRKAMEKTIGLRYSSALDMASDLERFARGQKVKARGITSGLSKYYRRFQLPIGVCFVVALLLAIQLLFYPFSAKQQSASILPQDNPIQIMKDMLPLLIQQHIHEQAYEISCQLETHNLPPNLDMAKAALASGNYQHAFQWLERLKNSSRVEEIAYYRAVACYQLARQERIASQSVKWLEEAVRLLERLEKSKNLHEASVWLQHQHTHGLDFHATLAMATFCHWYYKREEPLSQDKIEKLRKSLAESQVVPSQKGFVEWALGELMLQESQGNQEKLTQAIAHFSKAIQYLPENSFFYQRRAHAYYLAGKAFADIESDCLLSLQYAPRDLHPIRILLLSLLSPASRPSQDIDAMDITRLRTMSTLLTGYGDNMLKNAPSPSILKSLAQECYRRYFPLSRRQVSPEMVKSFFHTYLQSPSSEARARSCTTRSRSAR